jgi:hypothetical protein
VFVAVNDSDWVIAATSDAWTNWTARVVLEPGPNTIRAYAVDSAGDFSRTNSAKVLENDGRDDKSLSRSQNRPAGRLSP